MAPNLRNLQHSLSLVSVVACLASSASLAKAQNSIPVLPYAEVQLSNTSASATNPVTFNSAPLSLNCPAGVALSGTLSSTSDGTGKVLVDNYLYLTVTPPDSNPSGPYNLCNYPGAVGNPPSCFTTTYQSAASAGQLTGDDPDGSITASGGIGPIDISSYLTPGPNQIRLDLVDTGGYSASSSLYLATNCTSPGVNGGGQITGNAIPPTNPPPSVLTQTFNFSSGDNHTVQQVLDYSFAEDAGTLALNPNGATTPIVNDQAIDPALWSGYVSGTSFATSQCLVHFGELLNGSPACKLYTITCQIGQGSTATGAQCASSSARNIVIQDVFDGPDFFLPDIHVGNETFHQGFGSLMANEDWTGGPCTFDPASGQTFSCPENLLTQFTGPGLTRGKSTPQPNINSAFITVAPVPEYSTSIAVDGWINKTFVNQRTVNVNFVAHTPIVPAPNNGFVASPLYSITYGVSLSNLGIPDTTFPVPGDITLLTPGGCPAAGVPAQKKYKADPVQITVPADGKYTIHYFATDCAGTEELFFIKDPNKSWRTSFYTAKLFVDTTAPVVVTGPVLSPAPKQIGGTYGYLQGTVVTATYQCQDGLSGVAVCGATAYSSPVTRPSKVQSVVDTSTPGNHTFSVPVQDAAQNSGQTASVAYTVVAPQ